VPTAITSRANANKITGTDKYFKWMKKYLLSFLLIYPILVYSNGYTFKNFNPFDGLSTLKTNKVIQDKEGFIWIATDNGLNRFDGVNFKAYNQDINDSTSISGNVIMDLMIDHNNELWIATDGGICKYVKEYDNFEPAPDVILAREYSKSIVQDRNNNYWVISGSIISIFTKNWKKIEIFNNNPNHENYLGNISFFCLNVDDDGVMWIGTQNIGFISYNFETKELKKFGNRINTQEIYSIFPDSYGNVWVGTHDEAYLYKKEEDVIINLQSEDSEINLPRIPMSYMFEDNKGNIWICNWSKGVTKYNFKTNTYEWFEAIGKNIKSFSKGTVEYGYQDSDGNFWFTGATTGLTVLYANAKKMNIISDPSTPDAAIFNSPVTSITKDFDGNIWIGTDGNGITVLDAFNNIIKGYKHSADDSLSYGGASVLALYTDQNGRIWAGGYNSGFNLYNSQEDNFTVFKEGNIPPYNISGKDIREIATDKNGNIWVATNGGGVNKINPGTLEREVYKVEDGLAHNYCISLFYNEESDEMWIGSYGGLTILNISSGEIKTYVKDEKNKESLQSNWINDIFKDSKGQFWIATQLGVSLFDASKEKFTTFLESDGLANNSVMSIHEDSKGNIWIGTMNGLSKYDPEKKTFYNYNINDGLPDNQFRMGAVFNNGDKIYWGTNKGVLYFDPLEIKENPEIPTVRFTNLYLNNDIVVPGTSKALKKHIDYTRTIKLKSKENFFKIDFIGLSYYQAEKNTYKYMLEGVNDDWIDSKGNSYASYTNIHHGKYTFKVQAFNNDGAPSEIREINIRIRPAWYNTRIFWILLISLAIYTLLRLYQRREEQVKKDKKKLEEKIEENETKLKEKIKELEAKENEILIKEEHESELRFQHEGIAKFSDIIASHRENIIDLSTSLITNLVKYVDANAGIVYVVTDSDSEKTILKPAGDFCFDSYTNEKLEFEDGEGYIGTCFNHKKSIELNELPEGYIVLRSGLGDTNLKFSILCPIIHEENCLGVLEVASLEKLAKHKIEFIQKISENFASVLAISKANEQTKEMLRQNKLQSEELLAQEEEMRQNLEEMQATQEDLQHQMEANTAMQKKVEDYQKLLVSVLDSIPGKIFVKDHEHKLILLNSEVAKAYNTTVEKLLGTSDFDNHPHDLAAEYQAIEKKIIENGSETYIQEENLSGEKKYLKTTKMPFFLPHLNQTGLLGIQIDVTDIIEMEQKIKLQNEELLNQKEELKQKIEEISATQEELTLQMEENDKMQFELLKEKLLSDTLLFYANEHIYYKDEESRFIKVSQSMANHFKVDNVEDIYGKTDFDFFSDEHARPAYEDEQQIIKTGEPIIDKVEKEIHKDGTIKYVNTSKMPLYDENKEIIGTFGISKDITEIITMKDKAIRIMKKSQQLEESIKEKEKLIKELQAKLKK
jgi:PAS domain S-box-containing protein